MGFESLIRRIYPCTTGTRNTPPRPGNSDTLSAGIHDPGSGSRPKACREIGGALRRDTGALHRDSGTLHHDSGTLHRNSATLHRNSGVLRREGGGGLVVSARLGW
ncbi:hypothetical protein GCM10027089_57000 [Nocardia thraciensis]